MKPSTRAIGVRGEEAATRELARLGYSIIERNFAAGGGEIDIIARHGGVLVFIEVKARADDRFGTPLDAVSPAKQKRIIKAAKAYMAMKSIRDCAARFDVVSVMLDGPTPRVSVLADAFYVEQG